MPAWCTGILALPGERDHLVAARFAFALHMVGLFIIVYPQVCLASVVLCHYVLSVQIVHYDSKAFIVSCPQTALLKLH